MAVSGKFRFRKATFGALVLQVEDVRKSRWSSREKPIWRDAKALDLAAPEFRLLLDLGHGRPLVPISRAAVAAQAKPVHEGEPAPSVTEEMVPGSVVVH